MFSKILFFLLVAGFVPVALAEESLEYNRDIRPILSEYCFACHGMDSASREADLRLDQRDSAVDYGAIVAGEPDESTLIDRVFSSDSELRMPPVETNKQLTEAQKEMLRKWIEDGAEYQPHWAFVSPDKPAEPEVSNNGWIRNPIDSFVLSRLEREGLEPAPAAGARTLFRRLHFDITGLPPNPKDLESFVVDYHQEPEHALSEWIDRLMESPAWGEHRARYWLDAARYADTHGMHFDNYREMWPYRDWVIRALNENQPFDQFVIEQLAGDLLPEPSVEQLVATGFQRCNMTTNEGGTIDAENLAIYAADKVQTFGWVFMGLTVNCAQCHDHKYDPISMRDYYSLAAFFRNTEAPAKDGNMKDGAGPVHRIPAEADRQRWADLSEGVPAAEASVNERSDLASPDFQEWVKTATPALIPESPQQGLVLHLPMNEGSGDEVSGTADGPITISATAPVKWRPNGKLGPSVLLKTASTFTVGDYGDFEKDQQFSYGAWVKTTKKAANSGVNAGILARMDVSNGYRGWDLWQSKRTLSAHLVDTWDRNALKVSTTTEVVKPGKWQHVFVTYDGSGKAEGVKMYLDGSEVGLRTDRNSLAADATIRTSTPLRIGRRSEGAAFNHGAVQDVRVYNRVLSEDEIAVLAMGPPLQTILAKGIGDRTTKENDSLKSYYLSVHDTEYRQLSDELSALRDEFRQIELRSPITHIQKEKATEPEAYILMRGAYDQPGEKVSPSTPAALHPLRDEAPRNRLGLAMWVVDTANPLTARVTVNRFWQEIFRQGLVQTPEDFGLASAPPSHLELLNWLAIDFVEGNWDVKRFFKQIFMSSTYRQDANTSPAKQNLDPQNLLLSRGPRFRMDAEMIRDSALAYSGLLSQKMYGAGAKPYQPQDIWNVVGLPEGNTRDYQQDTGENLYRRSIYSFWKRMAPLPNMEVFNAPSREVCTVKRERTNTPLQALVTLNDPQFVEAARYLAQEALSASAEDDQNALDFVTLRVLSRRLTAEERDLVMDAKADYLDYYQKRPEDANTLIAVGEKPAGRSFDGPTLASWTMVCSQVMNLDEALNK